MAEKSKERCFYMKSDSIFNPCINLETLSTHQLLLFFLKTECQQWISVLQTKISGQKTHITS